MLKILANQLFFQLNSSRQPVTCFKSSPHRALLKSVHIVAVYNFVFLINISGNQVKQFSSLATSPGQLCPVSTDSRISLFCKNMASLAAMHRSGPRPKAKPKKKGHLEGNPQLRGVVLKTLIKKPKKPNSANRKCVLLRLTTGREAIAYVPGEGHNLQEHNIVLVEGGRLQDVPGVKLVCVRGKYDLAHVKKKV